jgi:peroxiredoxin Q/BCP
MGAAWAALALGAAGLAAVLWARRGRLLAPGSPAPPFALPNQRGRVVGTAELAGGWWLLYFYPKDQTPGCTREACAFRDRADDLASARVRVVGVSRDGIDAHRAFAERHGLGFDLLADVDGAVTAAYGARSALPGVARRVSYLVDPAGRIRKVYSEVSPARHAAQVAADARELGAGA